MSAHAVGTELPAVPFEPDPVKVILGNVTTLDFFPGLIDPDYARGAGHRTVFMNTMTQLSLMDRYVLDWAPEGRVKGHELVMRRPIYAGMKLELSGTVTRVAPFAGSRLAGPGTEVEVEVRIRGEDEVRTTGKVVIVVP